MGNPSTPARIEAAPGGSPLHRGPHHRRAPLFATGLFLRTLSGHPSVDQPDDKSDSLQESGPDHEARHDLHGKPEGNQNKVTKLKRFGSQAHDRRSLEVAR